MKQYNIFSAIPLSFFSKKLYADVIENWRGTAFGYLFVLLTLVWILSFIKISPEVAQLIEEHEQTYVQPMPTITIKNGELSMDRPSPYIVNDPQKNEPFLIIDTSGKYTSLDQTKAQILITKHKAFIQKNQMESRTFDFKDVADTTVTRDMVLGITGWFKHWVLVILFPLAVLFSFLYRLLQALIYAAIGSLIIAPLCKRRHLTYQQVLRACCVGVTPAIVVATGFELTGTTFPLMFLTYFLLAMAFITFAIRSVATAQSPDQD